MFQIYLLMVVANLLVGFLIAGEFFREKSVSCGHILDIFKSADVRLAIGILSVLVGIISLFKTYETILIIGDILPAVGALLGGLIISSLSLSEKSEDPPAFVTFMINFSQKISTPLGILFMVVGLVHAVAPTAIVI